MNSATFYPRPRPIVMALAGIRAVTLSHLTPRESLCLIDRNDFVVTNSYFGLKYE